MIINNRIGRIVPTNIRIPPLYPWAKVGNVFHKILKRPNVGILLCRMKIVITISHSIYKTWYTLALQIVSIFMLEQTIVRVCMQSLFSVYETP